VVYHLEPAKEQLEIRLGDIHLDNSNEAIPKEVLRGDEIKAHWLTTLLAAYLRSRLLSLASMGKLMADISLPKHSQRFSSRF
jgi:hypothetical protein